MRPRCACGNIAIRQLAISLEAIRIEEANKRGWELFKTYDKDIEETYGTTTKED